ncbi:hypothetical protein VMCG_03249 [Cytospora schulzeri]|uniref:Methyltransferase n=1 Tax=Cytospora schulzeri TaxID=448051 RepID=A0A423WXY7_9PEZI|nr:hypothetical protein VMCG_03249 [Valsa malicola]
MAKVQNARLNHIQWEDKFLHTKPTQYSVDPPEGVPKQNFTLALGPAQNIFDLRDCDETFELDKQGFTVRSHPLPPMTWDKDTIEATYLPMVIALVQETVPDATKIVPFDYRLRSSGEKVPSTAELAFKNFTEWIAPFDRVHVDQTPARAEERVIAHMGAEAPHLLKYRWRTINVWRPIEHPVRDCPLAVCDARSVGHGDLVAADNFRESFAGESYYMTYSPKHKWYYLSEQTKDEALLFKIHDSSDHVEAKSC